MPGHKALRTANQQVILLPLYSRGKPPFTSWPSLPSPAHPHEKGLRVLWYVCCSAAETVVVIRPHIPLFLLGGVLP